MNTDKINLQLFAVTQVTGMNTPGNSTEAELREFYNKRLIDHAEPDLVHNQFGGSYPIPPHGGKTINFRKFSPLEKATTPLTEGVTPSGKPINVDDLTATVQQYGDFVQLSDMLELTSYDPMIEQITKQIASQAGRTIDTIARETLCGGTQVIYAPEVVAGVSSDIEDREEINSDCKMTPNVIMRAAAQLKAMNAKPIHDSFVCIVHPYVSYDIMRNEEFIDVHKYADPETIYRGEIGKLGGVRFVETTEAKIIAPEFLMSKKCRFKLRTALDATGSTTIAVEEAITPAEAAELTAKIAAGTVKIFVGGKEATLASVTAGAAGAASFTTTAAVASVAVGAVVCGQGAGADGSAVFCSVMLADSAYGRTDLQGGGLETIIKQKGSAGTADPLNQRSTIGWKATLAVERLVEEYMIRIESGSAYSATAESN